MMNLRIHSCASGRKILIVGDSITLGISELLDARPTCHVNPTYVDRLRRMFPHHHIHVDAAIYRTTSGMNDQLRGLLDRYRPDIAILMLGGNDADVDWRRFILSAGRKLRSNVAAEAFAANLLSLAQTIVDAGAACILSDIPSPDLSLRGQWLSRVAGRDVRSIIERCGGQEESDRRLAAYNQAVRNVASATGSCVASWGKATESLPPAQRFGADFTHPGERSHRIIADVLAPFLGPKLPQADLTDQSEDDSLAEAV